MRFNSALRLIALFLCSFLTADAQSQSEDVANARCDCQPSWVPTFGAAPGTSPSFGGGETPIFALTVFDDGLNGPALILAGNFSSAGNVITRGIAKWNGMTWSSLGSGIPGEVKALAVFDDGLGGGPALYAGGKFTAAGGVAANRIAKWNGTTWSALGAGMNNEVTALVVHDDGSGEGPALYAGGNFTTAGGVNANRVARWNGTSWSPVGSGTNDIVLAFTVYDDGSGNSPALIAAGSFTTAGGSTNNRIAKWDGATWSSLGVGLNGFASALTVMDDGSESGSSLYAAGDFTSAGGQAANRIAKWNGLAWTPLGNGLNARVRTLHVFDQGQGAALYAGGDFTQNESGGGNRIAKWDGISWTSLSSGMDTAVGFLLPSSVYAMTSFNSDSSGSPSIFAGGSFYRAGDAGANHIAKWNGTSWSSLSTGLSGSGVSTIAIWEAEEGRSLVAGGNFTSAGGAVANRVAKWSSNVWTPLGIGMNGTVNTLQPFDDGNGSGPALYAGGFFDSADGIPANYNAKWFGDSWIEFGGGMNSLIRTLIVDERLTESPTLYAGGWFTTAGGVTVNRIAKWDGKSWEPLGTGVSGLSVGAIAVFDDGLGGGPALYAGGGFTIAGGMTANRIAKWSGTSWSPLGTGLDNAVIALVATENGINGERALFVGGAFTNAGGVIANRVAKWNGMSWSALGMGMNDQVLALAMFDDNTGNGPALYAGGSFTIAGGIAASNIAKWNGDSWSPLGSGVSGNVATLFAVEKDSLFGPALYVGGGFADSPAGDSFIARWQGCKPKPNCTAADINCDGVVNVSDLLAVISMWGSCPLPPQTCPADISPAPDGDGVVNVSDLLMVISNWG